MLTRTIYREALPFGYCLLSIVCSCCTVRYGMYNMYSTHSFNSLYNMCGSYGTNSMFSMYCLCVCPTKSKNMYWEILRNIVICLKNNLYTKDVVFHFLFVFGVSATWCTDLCPACPKPIRYDV